MDENTTNSDISLTESTKYVRRGRKSAKYYLELAGHGIVKLGPKKYRPNIVQDIYKGDREHELEELWIMNNPKSSLEKFEYIQGYVDSKGNKSVRLVSDTKPVYAYYPEDLGSYRKFPEVIIHEIYKKHKDHAKPCCSAKKDLEELSIIHQLSKEQQEWYNDCMRRRFGESKPVLQICPMPLIMEMF